MFRSDALILAVIALGAVALAAARPRAALADDLIGGIGLTHLTVYDQRPAPDGAMSGSPHVHAVTDEGYYVVSGRGRVELHDLESGFRAVELLPGRYVQFPPGVVHRLVSEDKLVLLVVMGNAGLAERGDARIYFGRAVDEDQAEFARLTGLAKAKGLEGALDRRDAAVRAYAGLVGLWSKDRKGYFLELERFIGVHGRAAAATVTVGGGRCANAPAGASAAEPPVGGPVVAYTRPTTSRAITPREIDAAIGRPEWAERDTRPESSGSVGATISHRTHGVCARRHNPWPDHRN